MHIKTGCLVLSFLISLPLFGMDDQSLGANCFSEKDLQLIEEIKYLARKAGNEEMTLEGGTRSTALQKVIKSLELKDDALYRKLVGYDGMQCTQEKYYAQIKRKIAELLFGKHFLISPYITPSEKLKKQLQIILANTPLTKPAENPASSKSREKLQRLALEAENPYINGEVDFSEEYKKLEKMGKKAGYIVGPLYPNLTIPDTSDHFRQFREKLLADCNDKTKKMKSDQEVSTGYVRSAKIDCQAAKLLGITYTYHPDKVMETKLKEIARKRVYELRRLLLSDENF